jgi:hypothetical protein
MATREINVERFSITSSKPFDEVIEAIDAAIGRPDIKAFRKKITSAKSFADVETVVQRAMGPPASWSSSVFILAKSCKRSAARKRR